MGSRLQLNHQDGRNRLFFLLMLGSLYLPSAFNSFFIALFVVHSFFTPGFRSSFKGNSRVALLLFSGFFMWNAISLFYTSNLDEGLFKLQTKLPFLIVPIAIIGSGIHRSREFRKVGMNGFLWFTLIAAMAALINAGVTSLQEGSLYKMANDDGTIVKQYYFTYTHLAFFIMHPAYFSLYVGTAIFMGLHLLINRESLIRQRWAQLVLLVFLFVFLFLLQGRMSILSFCFMLFGGVLIYFFASGSYLKGIALVSFPLLFLAAILIFAPPSLTRRFTEFNSMDYDLSSSSVYDFNGLTIRLAEWECALDAISAKPIAGHGLGDAHSALMDSYRKNNFVVGLDKGYNCHNQYLETPLQSGLIGILLLLGIFLWLMVMAYQGRDLLLFVLTGFFLISMLTESLLERQWAIAFFTAIFPYLALSNKRDSSSRSE